MSVQHQKIKSVSEVTNIYLAMAMSQLDSFLCKFKELLHSGRNAQLEVKSEAGKAVIKLTTEIEIPPNKPARSRNGPARQRRRERRAATRAAAATVEEAAAAQHEDELEVEEAQGPNEQPVASQFPDAVEARELEAAEAVEPKDEIENENISGEKPEEFSHSVSVIPVRKVNASDDTIGKVVKEKLALNGINVLEVYIQRSLTGIFSRCDARIEPVKGKVIDATNFEFENCRVIPIFGSSVS